MLRGHRERELKSSSTSRDPHTHKQIYSMIDPIYERLTHLQNPICIEFITESDSHRPLSELFMIRLAFSPNYVMNLFI